MSQASAISLPFPVARPRIKAMDTTGARDSQYLAIGYRPVKETTVE